jgi:hypothetical protein
MWRFFNFSKSGESGPFFHTENLCLCQNYIFQGNKRKGENFATIKIVNENKSTKLQLPIINKQ